MATTSTLERLTSERRRLPSGLLAYQTCGVADRDRLGRRRPIRVYVATVGTQVVLVEGPSMREASAALLDRLKVAHRIVRPSDIRLRRATVDDFERLLEVGVE